MPRQTNQEFMEDLMTFPKNGPLTHAFIFDILAKGAERILAANDEQKAQFENNFVSYEALASCATEVRDRLNAHLGTK